MQDLTVPLRPPQMFGNPVAYSRCSNNTLHELSLSGYCRYLWPHEYQWYIRLSGHAQSGPRALLGSYWPQAGEIFGASCIIVTVALRPTGSHSGQKSTHVSVIPGRKPWVQYFSPK